jgi:hypothetical protein
VLRGRGVAEPPFSFAEDQRLDAELETWAAALREHAARALAGDFVDLQEPVRQVKRAQAEAARERDRRLFGSAD